MPARPIHGRDDLLKLIQNKSIYTSCNRAIAKGNIEVLGGFSPPDARSYWCVRVWSKFGKQWFLRVSTTQDDTSYVFKTVDEAPPWAYWDGTATHCSSLIDGDNPVRCGALQIKALEEIVNGDPTRTD